MAVCCAPCRRRGLILASGERHLERELDRHPEPWVGRAPRGEGLFPTVPVGLSYPKQVPLVSLPAELEQFTPAPTSTETR